MDQVSATVSADTPASNGKAMALPATTMALRAIAAQIAALDGGWTCSAHVDCDGAALLLIEDGAAAASADTWVASLADDGQVRLQLLQDEAWLGFVCQTTPDRIVAHFAALRTPVAAR